MSTDKLLKNFIKSIYLYIIGEISLDDESISELINQVKDIRYTDLYKSINDRDLCIFIIQLINKVHKYKDSISSNKYIIMRDLMDDSLNAFKLYSYLNNISDDDEDLNDLKDEINNYINEESNIEYIEGGSSLLNRVHYLMSLAKLSPKDIDVENVTINDLSSIVRSDINNLIEVSTSSLGRYRINELTRIYNKVGSSTSEYYDSGVRNNLIRILKTILSKCYYPNHESISYILDSIMDTIKDNRFNKDDLSKNIMFLFNNLSKSDTDNITKLKEISSLIGRYESK